MSRSIRKDTFHATGVALATSIAAFAAAIAVTMSELAFAAAHDYRFEVVQVTSAGPGRSDVTVRLVRTADGKPVANADISANTAISTPVGQAGYRRFQVATAAAGPQTLQVSGKVPGATRIERTFNSSVKFWHERKVRGEDKVVTGVVTFTSL